MKNYVLDTNALLHDPNSLLCFQENNVLIPIEVMEELDEAKKFPDVLGRNARQVVRIIDSLREGGCLRTGIKLPNGGTLRILMESSKQQRFTNRKERRNNPVINGNKPDHRIMRTAIRLQTEDRKRNIETILVTQDINMRLRADFYGLKAECYETGLVPPEKLYSGAFDLEVGESAVAIIEETGAFTLQSRRDPNQYCMVFCNNGGRKPPKQFYMRVDASGLVLNKIHSPASSFYGISPRNREQCYVVDALLDDKIKLVTIMGKAGTGKTLFAMALGMTQVVLMKRYKRLIVSRPTISMGKEIGFLPGTLEEKLNPWMQPIHDALDLLIASSGARTPKKTPGDLLRSGLIVVEALTHIRGRSIPGQFMIVDEAQNLTPIEVKTIVTRAGQGTKIVLTGDPYQIDNPYVDSSSNGFNYVVSKFRQEAIAAHIELQRGERSELAEVAANIL